MIESDLYTHLKTDSGISAIVGARIYPKVAPQNATKPYLIYSEVVGTNKTCLGGATYQEDVRFQIDCWSLKYNEVKALKVAVKSALVGFKTSYDVITMDGYEPDTQLYRETIDFKLKG